MSLCWSMAALVIGVGGFSVLENAEPAAGDESPADMLRLAYPQRAPDHFLPKPDHVDDALPSLELRSEVARRQVRLSAQTESARRASVAAAARRASVAPVRSRPLELTVAPALAMGARIQVTLSYYYCARGPSGRVIGDGGGFCGLMRNGVRVHSGAAACAHRYLGQRFRIAGDPTGRTYTCEDTGSAVHGLHRDVWFNTAEAGRAWLAAVGSRAVIEIVP